jgi:diphthamide biosynthesis methyltransferase
MPGWDKEKNFVPDSFMEVVKDNNSIQAHSLILVDIGLEFPDALNQLEISAEKHDLELKKIIVCSKLGAKGKRILYGSVKTFKDVEIRAPFCFIIPEKLHFMEKEFLDMVNGLKS